MQRLYRRRNASTGDATPLPETQRPYGRRIVCARAPRLYQHATLGSSAVKRNLGRVLKQKLPVLKRLFASDRRIWAVFLFGSQADGSATPASDIDLGMLFENDLTLNEELALGVQVSKVLGTDDVDIVNLNRASLLFRFRAVAGRLLFERDYVRVSDFIERTLIEYRDFEPRAQAALRDYFATLGVGDETRPEAD